MDTSVALPYQGADLDHVITWTTLPRGERKRRATAACMNVRSDDARTTLEARAMLSSLTEAHLRAFGRMRESISPRTLSVYRRAMNHLIDTWHSANLLHPDRDDAARWLSTLEKS